MQSQTLILGIETSCDETAAAVVRAGRQVLSNAIASQIGTHAKYGGVVPELASREHLRAIVPVVHEAMYRAGCQLGDLNAIAVTQGPGLIGSLLVGITYAKAVCFASKLPLIGVNHVEGHLHSVLIQQEVTYPALALVVSGGHTHLYLIRDAGVQVLLGKTRDDAAGEAFDKVAKLLGLPYPGGPVIDQLAHYGDSSAVRFTPTRIKGAELDFSFSGLKTAVLRWTEANNMQDEIAQRRACTGASLDELLALTPQRTLDLLAGFQGAVISELLRRVVIACEQENTDTVVIAGGVASNSGLRKAASQINPRLRFLFPGPGLATDNAAMIAAAAFPKFVRQDFASWDMRAQASLVLG